MKGLVSHTTAQGAQQKQTIKTAVLAVQLYRNQRKGREVERKRGPSQEGERGVGPVSMGPGRTQAGPSSVPPESRPGHSIDIPTTGFPVMYG